IAGWLAQFMNSSCMWWSPTLQGAGLAQRLTLDGSPTDCSCVPVFVRAVHSYCSCAPFPFLRSGLGRRGGPLEFPQPRFNFVHESNVVVVLHDSSGAFVVSATQSAGPQIGMAQISYFHSCHAQRDREREEGHAK